jgi:hypothetical protein
VFACLVVVATLIATTDYYSQSKGRSSSSNRGAVGANYPRCTIAQLSVASESHVGVGGAAGGVLLFRNVSTHPCSLTGYPNVEAVGTSRSVTITASHVSSDMLGGWDWSGISSSSRKTPPFIVANGKSRSSTTTVVIGSDGRRYYWSVISSALKPPTVVLANRSDFASTWYQYSENGPAGSALFHANTLRVGLPGSTSVVIARVRVDAVEGRIVVTPFVTGRTGTGEPRAENSSDG